MNEETRRHVRERAGNRCEYCRTPQAVASFLAFHIEHIVANQHLVDDSLSNLALACPDCNRRKGPNLATIKAGARDIIRLFNPRTDRWTEHFVLNGARIDGISTIGIATARLLQFNSDDRVEIRQYMIETGGFGSP